MNYYTLLTNGYVNTLRTPPPLSSAPRINIPLILASKSSIISDIG